MLEPWERKDLSVSFDGDPVSIVLFEDPAAPPGHSAAFAVQGNLTVRPVVNSRRNSIDIRGQVMMCEVAEALVCPILCVARIETTARSTFYACWVNAGLRPARPVLTALHQQKWLPIYTCDADGSNYLVATHTPNTLRGAATGLITQVLDAPAWSDQAFAIARDQQALAAGDLPGLWERARHRDELPVPA